MRLPISRWVFYDEACALVVSMRLQSLSFASCTSYVATEDGHTAVVESAGRDGDLRNPRHCGVVVDGETVDECCTGVAAAAVGDIAGPWS